MKIGIPRGLLFYRFYYLWKTFLEELGQEVVISPPTNKPIIQRGLTYAVEEICFPAKVFLGHAHYLKDTVDMLFIPRVVSFHKGEYTCPKILGLPDLVRNLFDVPADRVIDDEINMRERSQVGWRQGFLAIGRRFVTNERRIAQALREAEEAHRRYRRRVREGVLPEVMIDGAQPLPPRQEKVLMLGHTYLINESFINMNIIQKVHEMGFSVITPDMVDPRRSRRALKEIPKASFWTFSNEILGSTLHILRSRPAEVKGFIHLVSFECGPDSLVGEVIGRLFRREKDLLPYLRLEIDEHTGEAGLVTRLEAFVDMMRWRYAHRESYVSPSCSS